MIKKCFFLTIFLLFASTLFAYEKGGVFFCLKGGIGASFPVSYNNYKKTPGRMPEIALVWNTGVSLEYSFKDNIIFNAELLYEYQPLFYKDRRANITYIYDFSYITIPAGIRFIFAERFLVGAGLHYSFKINSAHSAKSRNVKISLEPLPNEQNDIGIFVDIGLNFKLSETNNLSAYFRVKHGFIDVIKDTKIIANAATINAAYNFMF